MKQKPCEEPDSNEKADALAVVYFLIKCSLFYYHTLCQGKLTVLLVLPCSKITAVML